MAAGGRRVAARGVVAALHERGFVVLDVPGVAVGLDVADVQRDLCGRVEGVRVAALGRRVAAVAALGVAALGLGVATEGERVALAGGVRLGVGVVDLRVAGAGVAAVAADRGPVAADRRVAALVELGLVGLDRASVAVGVDVGQVEGDLQRGVRSRRVAALGLGVTAAAALGVAALGLGVATEGDGVTLVTGGGRVRVAQAGLRVAGVGVAAVAAVGRGVAARRVVVALVDRAVVALDRPAAVGGRAVDEGLAGVVGRGRTTPVGVSVAAVATGGVAARGGAVAAEADDVPVAGRDVMGGLRSRLRVRSGGVAAVAGGTGSAAARAGLVSLRDARRVVLTGGLRLRDGDRGGPRRGEDQCSCSDVPLLAHNSLAAPSRCPPARSLVRRVLEGPRQDLFANGGEIRQSVSIALLPQRDWWVMKQRFLPGRYSRYPRYPALAAI